MVLPCLTVALSGKEGRGMFTTEDIPANTVIEISPVLVLTAKEREIVEQTKLYDYIFEWGKSRKLACVAFGYVSIYNHDYNSNCDYEMDFEQQTISIKTVRKIKKGEELFINYNANPNDKTKIWFDAK